jgi:ubiquitin-conjugating enzyme E2 O
MGTSNMLTFLMGNGRPGNVDTVVYVEHTVLAVCWLAIRQTVSVETTLLVSVLIRRHWQLDPAESQVRKRPERLWYREGLSKLTLVKTRSDQDIRVGDKVILKDATDAPMTIHGQEGDPAGTVIVSALIVQETRTVVNVLWQDGTQETIRSTELIPYMNPDEYDCW